MSCRHVSASGYRCSRPSLPAHRGYCRQHASMLHLPPPVPPPSQPSRRGGRGGGAAGPPTSVPAAPHGASDANARRRSSSAGRTPTVEQLLGRIDRLRASSPSAESAWSEDSDHETLTLGSSRQYAASGCTGDSSEAESGPEGPETVDVLHRAGVYTAEEAALLSRDKLVRQQALYIQQFSRLQHLLREGRRRYLHEVKLERQAEAEAAKERQLAAEAGEDDAERPGHSERGSAADAVPGRSGGRGTAQRDRHDAEEKLRAVWRYHRHRGVCAVLRRKAWDRRSDTPAPPGPRCVHTEGGVRCSERCLPGSKFCLKHILNDPHQMLFVPCVGRRSLTLEQRDDEFSRSRPARAAAAEAATSAHAAPAPSSAGKAWSLKSVNMEALQRELDSKRARDITAAVRRKDAAAFAAALGVEKTPSIEKLVRRRTVARIVDAMERRDAAGVMAARMSAEKSGSSPQKVAAPKEVRGDSAREVMHKSRRIAALAAVLQSEEAVRLVAALNSKDPAAVFAALKSKDAAAVVAALRAKDATALSTALRPGVPPAESGNPSNVPAEAAAGVLVTRSAGPANVPAPATPGGSSNVPATSRFPEAVALMAALNPADKAAVTAALRAKDTDALKKILKSESVAPIMADLKAKGILIPAKAAKSDATTEAAKSDAPTVATSEGTPVPATAARPGPVAPVGGAVTRGPGDVAASSSAVRPEDVRETVPVKSGNGAGPVATPKSENAGASTAAPKSGNSASPSVALGSRVTAISPKSKTIAARGLALEGKVTATSRTKSAAAKAAAAKLKVAATTLAARKAKKMVQCKEPVLCVFEADMRCPWHTVYVPDVRHAVKAEAAGSDVPKLEVKKEEADEDRAAECFGPVNKKIKMELDELTPDIGCIIGEVEMKMETNDEAADDMASVSGSGNQADLSTESTLSATSPRADDDDMDDDCRDMDVDVEEVMLQTPLGADDADLVAVAQGVAVVGAQEEVQQDDDSLTNPPAAVDEVEVS